VSPYPARMEDHWWQRPGRRQGRELYQWDLLFRDCPEVHAAVAQVQARLTNLPLLDLVDLQWLHVTTYIAGFADEIPSEAVGAMVDEASRLLAHIAPITVTIGRIYLDRQAVVLPVEPFAALDPVLSAARAATNSIGASGHQDTDPWAPHISVAYSNGSGPAAPVIAALGERLPDHRVTISSLSLVAQVQAGRSWQWREIADVRLGHMRFSSHDHIAEEPGT
jgi:2'-5' RNA ligase